MTTPLPFTWPYGLIFWAVYLWAFIPEFRLVRKATHGTPVPAEDRGSLRVLLAGGGLSILAAFVIPLVVAHTTLPGDPVVWFCVGLVVLICGSLLRRHCFRVLGAFFTGAVTIQPGHRVVESGAYRWVRHPSYSAALLLVLGIALALGNWLSVAVSFAGAFVAYSYRAQVEEKALLAALGDPYARFMAARKRFIPFIC